LYSVVRIALNFPRSTCSISSLAVSFAYEEAIIKHLKYKGISVINYGTDGFESVDYPDFVHPVAKDVNENKVDFGILICGSANGVAMTANKYPNVRAGICWMSEITVLTRQHNNANIICIPARYTAIPQAIKMVDTFLETKFEGGRHQNRVSKIPISC
jgi:ribose 5-phosphate isomerase B